MQDLNASVCLPSFIENKMIGFLMLGEKLSGDMYTQEDLDLFSTLANQAALAIENAQAYEELKDTRDQLIHSERLATIGRFANEVAHEIKNPLQAIKTFVEFLPQKYADKNFREKFTRIVGAEIERINTFVKQLAGFSKPKPLDFQPVDLNQILDATLLLLENDFKKKGVLVKKKYPGAGIRLSADKDQLKQAFLNIFLNSLEAMEEGNPNQLIVETSADNSRLNIKISDTGCGISKENLKRLFQPFFSTKGKGAGLGLAITKNIIENHKGRISVESELGRGTSFLISFPGLAED
jgi:signal transduction histidine kinase